MPEYPQRQYVAILIRLFSIGLIVVSLRELSVFIELLLAGGVNGVETSILLGLITSFSPIVIAVVLWFFPMLVAGTIVRSDMNDEAGVSVFSTLYVIVAALGLFLICNAISDLFYLVTLVQLISEQTYQQGVSEIIAQSRSSIVASVVELVLGLVFVFWCRSISDKIIHVSR